MPFGFDGEGRKGNTGEFASAIPLEGCVPPNLENLRQLHIQLGSDFAAVSDMLDHVDPAWPSSDERIHKPAPALTIVVSAVSAVLDPGVIGSGGQLPTALAEPMIAMIAFSSVPQGGGPPSIRWFSHEVQNSGVKKSGCINLCHKNNALWSYRT